MVRLTGTAGSSEEEALHHRPGRTFVMRVPQRPQFARASGDNVTWQVPLKDNTKKIGPTGKMNITWTGTHGVYEIPSSSCPSAFAPGNGQTELVKPQDGGNYVWQPPADAKAGSKYYLTDQVDDNCKKGLLLTVTIK